MRSKLLIAAMIAFVLVGAPALAGGPECQKSAAAKEAKVAQKGHTCTADAQMCLNKMATKFRDKGWVGVELDEYGAEGAMTVTRVEPDSPALRAGLSEGDVLLAVNGVQFGSDDEEAWASLKSEMRVGNTITYTIERDGREKQVGITLAAIPEPILAKWVGSHMLQHATIEVAQN